MYFPTAGRHGSDRRRFTPKEMDKRPIQILALDGKIRETRCSGISDIPDFLVRLDWMWAEFESLGDPRSDYLRRAPLLSNIGDASPNLLDQLTSRPASDYNDIRWSTIPSN